MKLCCLISKDIIMKKLITFFYRQHLFGNLLTAVLIIISIYSVYTIRKDIFPKVEFDTTIIAGILPGASPEQVESLMVNPIEQALREIDGIKKVTSTATDSRAVVTVQLDPDARKTDKTNSDIQRAVDRIEDWPSEAEKPIVSVLDSGQSPVIELTVSSDKMSEMELRDAAKFIADELLFVPGVAKITKAGWRKKEIQVQVDERKLQSLHVSLSDIITSVKSQNIQLPGGDLLLPDKREMTVKTDGEFKSIEDVKNTVIRSNFDGFGAKIKDVALVAETLEKPNLIYKTNGRQSFSLIVIKKEQADALKVVEAVKQKTEDIQPLLSKDLKLEFVNDFTFYLKNRIGILSSNMITGIFLVMLVLALFLPWKIAAIVAIGIPFSMLTAITVFKALGFSLNLVSLIGLIIVSGMLVDDAIVVIENVFRRIENGDDLDTAVIEGTSEIVPAVMASVLTTVVAFAPMMFMSGIFGKFIYQIPVMVILPLLISLFESFFIAPGHLNSLVGVKGLNQLKEIENKEHWYDKLLPKYKELIHWTVSHYKKTILAFFSLVVVTGVAASQVKFILFPPEGIYSFFVRVDGENGATLQEMDRILTPVEKVILTLPKEELKDFVTQIGIQQNDPNDPLTKRSSNYAQIRVNLTPESDRQRSVSEIVEYLRNQIGKPEGSQKISFEIAKGGPPQGRPVSINLYGDDYVELNKIALQVKEVLNKIDGVKDIEDSEVIGKKELKVTPDKSAMGAVGVTTQDMALTLRAAFAGVIASSNRSLDEEIDIRVQLKSNPASPANKVNEISVGNRRGDLIPLNRIAQFSESNSRLTIQHEKYKRIINVSAQIDLTKTTATKVAKLLQPEMKKIIEQFPRYDFNLGGENEDTAESMQSLMKAFLVAFIAIFFILILTFGSFLQPTLVLVSLPLGFIGVIWALIIHGKPLSFMAMLGIIALAGVIVNNAIIYIDFFNAKIKEGVPLNQALVEAAATRLRPIILTSLTTVLGLMPTAYGIGGTDGFVTALALSLGWGLALGSILTVLIFPSLIKSVEEFKLLMNRKFWSRF